MKKILCMILVLCLALASVPSFADETMDIGITIEGAFETVLEAKKIEVAKGSTALDAVKLALDAEGIEYGVTKSDYGDYLSEIGDDKEGMFGGYEGFMYTVNDESPSVSIGKYELSDGDNLLVFFGGMDTYVPQIEVRTKGYKEYIWGEDMEIYVWAEYFDWYTNESVAVAIKDAKIDFGGESFITDENGLAVIPKDKITEEGKHRAYISGDREGNYPFIVRGWFDFSVEESVYYDVEFVPEIAKEEVAKEEINPQKELDEVLSVLSKKEELSEFDIIALGLNDEGEKDVLTNRVVELVNASGGRFRKSTDISKLIMASVSVGIDPKNVGGMNLTEKLCNFENIEKQGVNASVFALVAQKMAGEDVNSKFIENIISAQNEDGSIPIAVGSAGSVDMTAMAIYALCDYIAENEKVAEVVNKAVLYLSAVQQDDGGFMYEVDESAEAVSQVIMAICSCGLGIDDKQFIKENGSLLENLISFKTKDGFVHIKGEEKDDMATSQAALALTAIVQGGSIFKAPIYKDVFKGRWSYDAISLLKTAGIISGDENGYFNPSDFVTREQFVKMLMSTFEIDGSGPLKEFSDVEKNSWYESYVISAVKAGIINGISEDSFGVGQKMTREQMATVIYRIYEFNTDENVYVKDIDDVSDYAKDAVKALYSNGIITGMDDGSFSPKNNVTREQTAVIICRLAELIMKGSAK